MVHLVQGYSSLGNFTTQQEVHHFYEFFVNETASTTPGHIGVLVTGLNRAHTLDDTLQLFVSTKTSRPLPESSQWTGLQVDDGAFLGILNTDSQYVKEVCFF